MKKLLLFIFCFSVFGAEPLLVPGSQIPIVTNPTTNSFLFGVDLGLAAPGQTKRFPIGLFINTGSSVVSGSNFNAIVVTNRTTIGSGDNFGIQTTISAGQLMDIRRGTMLAPVTTSNGPAIRVNQTLEIPSSTTTGDGSDFAAAVQGLSQGATNNGIQPVGVYGGAKSYSTNQTTSGADDALGGYFLGRSYGTGAGIGLTGYAMRETTNGFDHGMETVIFNNSGVPSIYTDTGVAKDVNILMAPGGTADSVVGIQFHQSRGVQWAHGIAIGGNTVSNKVGAVRDSSFRDDGDALVSLEINGKHTNGAIVIGNTSGSVLIGESTPSFAGTRLEVISSNGFAADPLMFVGHPAFSSNYTAFIRNSVGTLRLGIAGTSGFVINGTVPGDSIITPSSNDSLFLGVTEKVITISSNRFALFGAVPVDQQAQTVDLKVALTNSGLISATSGATPLNLNGGDITANSFIGSGTIADSNLQLPDDDASHKLTIQADNTTTTDVNLIAPAAPFTGLLKGTVSGTTNWTLSQAVAGVDYSTSSGIAGSIINPVLIASLDTQIPEFSGTSGTNMIPSTNNLILWNATQATRTLTANLSGATDPVLTFGNNSVTVSTPFIVGGALSPSSNATFDIGSNGGNRFNRIWLSSGVTSASGTSSFANVSVAPVVADTTALTASGGSTTGSGTTKGGTFMHTLNTSGNVDGVWTFGGTDTASGSGTEWFMVIGGAAGTTELFKVDKNGNTIATSGSSVGASSSFLFTGRGGLSATANGVFRLSDSAITGGTSLQIGPDDAAPNTAIYKAPNGVGTDIGGGPSIVQGGQSTGTGAPGKVQGQRSTIGTTGSSANAYGTAFSLGGTLDVNTTTTGNVGAGEDNLITYSIPAGQMSVNGDTIDFDMAGTFAATVNAKRLRVYFGATAVFDSTSLVLNGLAWRVHGKVIRTGATTQKATIEATIGGTLLSAVNSTITQYTTPGETLSGAVTIKATGSDDGGVPADNAVVQQISSIRFYTAP
jgi:hypothetical protein